MNVSEIERLAVETARWMNTKRVRGLGDILTESHLVLSVAEYLVAQNWSHLRSERHSELGSAGDINFDLEAKRNGKRLLIETKLLKRGHDQKIIRDLVKLAYAKSDSRFTRLLLISELDNGSPRSSVISEVRNGNRYRFRIAPVEGSEVSIVTTPLAKLPRLTGADLRYVRKILDSDTALREFSVETIADIVNGNDRVTILEIRRR